MEGMPSIKEKEFQKLSKNFDLLIFTKIKMSKVLQNTRGGKATTKKNGNSYFYYYCNDCKLTIKENIIEEYISEFIDDIVEYDLDVLYINKDDGMILEDEEAVFKYIPDKMDGVLTREVKPTIVKPANQIGLEECMIDE